MNPKSWIILRVLLNKYHKGSPDAILSYLPQDDVKTILSQNVTSSDPLPSLETFEDKIGQIHYSWLVEPMQKIPKPIQEYALGVIPSQQRSGLAKLLNMKEPGTELHPFARLYFLDKVYQFIDGSEILPVEYLPASSLNELVELDKNQLVEVLDLLGLYDLVHELKHVVDKRHLKRVYACLTKKEQGYLKIILHQRDRLQTPHLGIEHWNGNRQKLESVLHRRGIIRLGKAMAGAHPHLLWHVAHRLDTGRGQILVNQYAKEEIPGVTASLSAEVMSAINYLKQNG